MRAGRSMCQNILITTAVVYLFQILITVPEEADLGALFMNARPAERQVLTKLLEEDKIDELKAIAVKLNYVTYGSLLENWGALDPYKVANGQIWRLVTYAFLHDRSTPWHIVFNMLVLWMFGRAIEELWGRYEFLAFYLAAAVAAGLCHLAFGLAMHDPVGAVGASGSLMGVMMAFAIYYPHTPITIFFLLTLEARWMIVLYLIYDAFPILQALSGQASRSDGIAHAAHLGGLVFGYLYCKSGWKLTGWMPKRGGPSLGQLFSRWLTRPALRVYRDPVERSPERAPERAPERPQPQFQSPRDLEHKVDAILKKIKDEGEASLSEEERKLLRDASHAYKKRNT